MMNIEARENQLQYWGNCILDDCKIDEVKKISDLWDWMEHELVPLAFPGASSDPNGKYNYYEPLSDLPTIYALNEKSVQWKRRYVGDTKTVIQLGNIRVRQLRIRKNFGCAVKEEFQGLYQDCYPPFKAECSWVEANLGNCVENESKLMFAKRWTPAYIERCFKW
jgi:hypothetical protein